MFNPSLHTLLVQAHADERQRAAQSYNRGRDGMYSPTARVSTLLKRVIAGLPWVHDDVAPAHGFELLSRSPAATLRPRS